MNRFELNSIPQALIEARFCGDDPAVLDSLTQIAVGIMRNNPKALNPRNEWGNMAMNVQAEYDPVKAGKLNIGRSDMMMAVKSLCDGVSVGVYRDENKKFQFCSVLHLKKIFHKNHWRICRYGTVHVLLHWLS